MRTKVVLTALFALFLGAYSSDGLASLLWNEPKAQVTTPSSPPTPSSTLYVQQSVKKKSLAPLADVKQSVAERCKGWEKLPATKRRSSSFFCWNKVGGDPYQGKPEQALNMSGLPLDVQRIFLNKIRLGERGNGIVQTGDVFDWMVFGRPNKNGQARVRHAVLANWEPGETHRATIYTLIHDGKEYRLFQIADCGNWAGTVHVVQPPAKNMAPAAPPAQKVAGRCSGAPYIRLLIYEPKAVLVAGVRAAIADESRMLDITQPNPNGVAIRYGKTLWDMKQAGTLSTSSNTYTVTVGYGGLSPVLDRTFEVTGELVIEIPHVWEATHVRFVFEPKDVFVSPSVYKKTGKAELRSFRKEYSDPKRGCGKRMTAIEAAG